MKAPIYIVYLARLARIRGHRLNCINIRLHHIHRKLADIQIKGKRNGIIENIAKEKALASVERKSNDRDQREWVMSFRNRKQKQEM